MNKLKKNLLSIYSNVSAPAPAGNEFTKILSKIRSTVPTTRDKLIFTLAFASIVLAVIYMTPSEMQVDQSQSLYIYNFSGAFDPS